MPTTAAHILQVVKKDEVIEFEPHQTISEAIPSLKQRAAPFLLVKEQPGRRRRIVTLRSIADAALHLNSSPGGLKVAAAAFEAPVCQENDDISQVLMKLEKDSIVFIEKSDRSLAGFIDAAKVAEYYRSRAEDMMLLEDVEAYLRDHVVAAFSDVVKEDAEAVLFRIVNAQRRTLIEKAIKSYVGSQKIEKEKVNQVVLDEIIKRNSENKTIDDLTLSELLELFFSRWDQYGVHLHLGKEQLRDILNQVRVMRNTLAHFRGELTANDKEKLRFCADILNRSKGLSQQFQSSVTAYRLAGGSEGSDTSHDLVGNSSEPAPNTLDDESDAEEYGNETHPIQVDQEAAPTHQVSTFDKVVGSNLLGHSYSDDDDSEVKDFWEIEDWAGSTLPEEAFIHRGWWVNDPCKNWHAGAWLTDGYRVAEVDMDNRLLLLVRQSLWGKLFGAFWARLLAKISDDIALIGRKKEPQDSWVQTIWSYGLYMPDEEEAIEKFIIYAELGPSGCPRVVYEYSGTEKGRNEIYGAIQLGARFSDKAFDYYNNSSQVGADSFMFSYEFPSEYWVTNDEHEGQQVINWMASIITTMLNQFAPVAKRILDAHLEE